MNIAPKQGDFAGEILKNSKDDRKNANLAN
jgi:hypothetical protein